MFFNVNTLMQPKNKKEKVTNMNNYDICAIWYHLYNLKNMKNNYGGVQLY